MRTPSVKSLLAAFRDLDSKGANLIRKLAKACDDSDALSALIATHCLATFQYARSCHGDPFATHMWRVTLVLHAIDTILGTHGVECLGEGEHRNGYAPPYEYCNTGDSYATTLIYKRATDNLYIGSWATIAERMPRT